MSLDAHKISQLFPIMITRISFVAVPMGLLIGSTPVVAHLAPMPPSVCQSDYRQVAKQRWLDALDAVEQVTPQVPARRIVDLKREEAPLLQAHLPTDASDNEPMNIREKRERKLRLTLNRQPDYIAWRTHKLVSFLRGYPGEIDRVGLNNPIDQRFYELRGGISFLTELGEDVRTLGIYEGGFDYTSSRATTLLSINNAVDSLVDIGRCDEKRLLGRDE